MNKIIFAYTLLCLIACGASTNNQNEQPTQQTTSPVTGKYEGMLPCADCSGLETELQLMSDFTFNMRLTYRAKDTTALPIAGTFSIDEKNNVLRCVANNNEWKYRIGKNTLTQLDQAGNEITGKLASQYILTKKKKGFK